MLSFFSDFFFSPKISLFKIGHELNHGLSWILSLLEQRQLFGIRKIAKGTKAAEDFDGLVADMGSPLEIVDGSERLLFPCRDNGIANGGTDSVDAGNRRDDLLLLLVDGELGGKRAVDVDPAEGIATIIHLDSLLVGVDKGRFLGRDRSQPRLFLDFVELSEAWLESLHHRLDIVGIAAQGEIGRIVA